MDFTLNSRKETSFKNSKLIEDFMLQAFISYEFRTVFVLVKNDDFWKLVHNNFVSFKCFSINISMANERKLEGISALARIFL